jgi:glycosyltransferase involved in cell wall biosynthesis
MKSADKKRLKLFIIADNLRIGGIQRIVLDEAYQFESMGISPKIIILSKPMLADNILRVDHLFNENSKLDITFLRPNKLFHLIFFCKLHYFTKSSGMFICHSTSAAFLLKISSLLMFKKSLVLLFIHQLLSLSDTRQKHKRIFYSMFADKILFSSKQFLREWNHIIRSSHFFKIYKRRPQEFIRMGVYLPRLMSSNKLPKLIEFDEKPSLIFLSRTTKWKGLDRYINICNNVEFQDLKYLLFLVGNEEKTFLELFNHPKSVLTVNELGINSITVHKNSIHLYPSYYGVNVMYPQSIGMNVLEMISLGIVSLISKDDLSTWPEFKNSNLVRIVDWDNFSEVIQEIKSCLNLDSRVRLEEIKRLLNVVSIESHCKRLIEYSNG